MEGKLLGLNRDLLLCASDLLLELVHVCNQLLAGRLGWGLGWGGSVLQVNSSGPEHGCADRMRIAHLEEKVAVDEPGRVAETDELHQLGKLCNSTGHGAVRRECCDAEGTAPGQRVELTTGTALTAPTIVEENHTVAIAPAP